MPFLEEHVWKIIGPLLDAGKKEIQAYRLRTGFDLKTARENIKPEVTQEFHRLTNIPGIHFDIISHHRLSNWGPECKNCGHLLRTAKAKYCAHCGKSRICEAHV